MNHSSSTASAWFPLLLVGAALLAGPGRAVADTGLGQLTCERIAGTTRNFIVTSSADVRCIFEGQGGLQQWYVGETGVALGLDLKWTKTETINFAVLSSTTEFTPEGSFLVGEYAGAKADAALGVGAGAAVLIGGSDDTTALQPAMTTGEGVGVSVGVGYLTLKPDGLNVARTASLRGDAFTAALYSAYFNVALEEYRDERYVASDLFADKALSAAAGQRIAPNRTEGQAVTGADLQALGEAHARVMKAREHAFADTAVGEVAAVQASYDCWLNAALPPAAERRAAQCREAFESRIVPLEAHLTKLADDAAMEQQLLKPRWWTVYFDTDASDLDGNGEATVEQVVESFRSYKSARVYVWGHTDRVGSEEYNQILSNKRSASTRNALVRGGIPQDWIRTVGYGEAPPYRISTNAHDATNRRVDIVVEPLAVRVD